MDKIRDDNAQWSPHEMEMLTHVEVFQHKPGIMKKGEDYLKALEQAMVKELAGNESCFPAGTKLQSGQLVRGENHKGFPYLSLDIPQKFSKTEMFAYRTLFWWGHYLGFSLILKGEKLPDYVDRLLAHKNDPMLAGVYLAAAPTPWEWNPSNDNFKQVRTTPGEELKSIVESIEYIKLCRFFPFEDASFSSLDWVETGLTAWRDYSKFALED